MIATNGEQSRMGVGLYSVADAARLVHAHPATIRRWLLDNGGIVPRILPEDEQTLTFQELMELHFIQMFRSKGVSFQAIRRSSQAAAQRFKTDYPFSVKRFDTDGRTVFATLIRENQRDPIVEDLQHQQLVFRQIVRPFFRKLEYRTDTDQGVMRFWPRTKRGRVVLDPQRKFGRPIDSETGVPTSAIVDSVQAGGGQSPAVVARWLDIPVAAVRAAVAFEASLAD